ncbi:sulfotransferase family protein [Parahaliea mediterranea]|uniref:Sulfotransferase n=1 Tax=Parahaliea mediterranea TaxID=651086 RepID=A0A939ILF5_9GAMM|nr:sulfotransferase [Parahaliea mediterranea]MBN7795918.1 sulfotransferase [Parahaliea mediterranea]
MTDFKRDNGAGPSTLAGRWSPPPHPDWLRRMNAEGACFDLPGVVPLDENSLLRCAREATGLADFGDDVWREPFQVLLKALEAEAGLTLMGRLMARSDILLWLQNRLRIVDTFRRHPEIHDEPIDRPIFITGLARSGTSVLFELLSRDPALGSPQTWETFLSCPPPAAASYATDPRREHIHALVTQWSRVVPEFATMHEMGGHIPAECGMLWANTFISDHIAALYQIPSYHAWYASADLAPVYAWHRQMLQLLQWRNPRRHWLLKAPEHLGHLPALLEIYPDARVIQTHRDPIRCMSSATSLLGSLYWMRSDRPFDATAFAGLVEGEATAARLERVMAQRAAGLVPSQNIHDLRYADLLTDPMACIEALYTHFHMPLTEVTRGAMTAFLADKPQGKFGSHQYGISAADHASRRYFAAYQAHYGVPSERA